MGSGENEISPTSACNGQSSQCRSWREPPKEEFEGALVVDDCPDPTATTGQTSAQGVHVVWAYPMGNPPTTGQTYGAGSVVRQPPNSPKNRLEGDAQIGNVVYTGNMENTRTPMDTGKIPLFLSFIGDG